MSPALAERNAQIHLPKKLRRRRGDVCKDASFGLLSFVCKRFSPPTVQTNLGGRIFASCVALGRNFGATFRNACPPPASSSAPSALRRESRAARRRGDRAKGYAEIPTQGNARREVPPPTSGLSGCCLVTANILQTCFHHVPANLYGQYLTRDALVPLFRQFGGKRGSRKVSS